MDEPRVEVGMIVRNDVAEWSGPHLVKSMDKYGVILVDADGNEGHVPYSMLDDVEVCARNARVEDLARYGA